MFYIGFYRENHEKIFLSETARPKVLIFSMKHHLVNVYQVCSNNTPGAKKWIGLQGHMFYIDLKNMKKISSLKQTIWPRALIFVMKHHLVNLYQVCSNYFPGAKTGPAPGVTCFT